MNATQKLLMKKFHPDALQEQEEKEASRRSDRLSFIEGILASLGYKEEEILFKSTDAKAPWNKENK